MTARAVNEQPSGWALTITLKGDDPLEPPRGSAAVVAADHRFVVTCGDGQWHRTMVPIADRQALAVEAQGRWSDPETFAAELVFVHTPHRMSVRYAPATGTSSARWRSIPLGRVSLTRLATPVSAE